MSDMYDVWVDVPGKDCKDRGHCKLAEAVTKEFAEAIQRRVFHPTTMKESSCAPCAEAVRSTRTRGCVTAAGNRPSQRTEYVVWMQRIYSDKRPWVMIADGLTLDDAEAFMSSPARNISVQPRKL